MAKHSQSSQNNKFAMPLHYLKKEVIGEDKQADKHQSFPHVNFNTLGIKVFYKVIPSLLLDMIKHSQSTQSKNSAISLQYLKKEVRNGFIFCMEINIINLSKLALSLMEVTRYVKSPQDRKLVIFLQYVKKIELQLVLCSIVMQNIQNFTGVQPCSLFLVFGCFWSKMGSWKMKSWDY